MPTCTATAVPSTIGISWVTRNGDIYIKDRMILRITALAYYW